MNARPLAVAAILALAACSSAQGPLPVPAIPAQPTSPLQNRSFGRPGQRDAFTWGRSMLSRMTYVAPLRDGAMTVDVLVRMRDASGLARYAQDANDPKSATYRRFLTPEQIAERFGASEGDYASVARYFAGHGMRVGMWPQREIVAVTGTIAQFQRAFGTSFAQYRYGDSVIIGPSGTPHFERPLPVTSVMHLQSYSGFRGNVIRGNYAIFSGYTPEMVARGLDYAGAYEKNLTGRGISAGVIGTGPISAADASLYSKRYGAAMARILQVDASPQPAAPVNGHTGTGTVDPYPAGLAHAPPATGFCSQSNPPNYMKCNPEDGEAQVDSQQVAGLAPGAVERFYLAYNPSICLTPAGKFVRNNKDGSCPPGSSAYPLIGLQLIDDSLQQAIADNKSDSISMSFGEPENDAIDTDYVNARQTAVGNVEMASLAAEGIALFAASGDNGASECIDPTTKVPLGIACAFYPATDPSVTAVGGVNLQINESGLLSGEITAWADNTTGGGSGTLQNDVGSGGGISAVFKAPAYQSAALKGVTTREIPDIALDADPKTGVAVVANAAFAPLLFPVGGTSIAAPQANAEWALVLQACAQSPACATAGGAKPFRLGNPAAIVYRIYSGNGYLPYDKTFYDVLYGNNKAKPIPGASPSPAPTPRGYNAGRGYDMVTGVGVPFAGHLIDAIVKGAAVP